MVLVPGSLVSSGYITPYGEGFVSGDYQGIITQIELGAPYPYLIDREMWVNSAKIDADPHVSTMIKLSIGDWVGVRRGATDYNGNAASGCS